MAGKVLQGTMVLGSDKHVKSGKISNSVSEDQPDEEDMWEELTLTYIST
jgi:hypothetical protein